MQTMNATTQSELLSSPIGVLEGGSLEALEDASWASDIGDGNSASLFFDLGTSNEERKQVERPCENTNGKSFDIVPTDPAEVASESQEPFSCGPNELGENDIPLGRSAEVRDYVGNVRYRAVIERHRGDYLNATKRVEKTRISNIVFRTIKQRGGRFMDKENKNSKGKSRWVEISQEKALAKISQALRMGVGGTEFGMGNQNTWMNVPMNYPYSHPGAPAPYGGHPPSMHMNTPPRGLQPSGMTISVPSFQPQPPYTSMHMPHSTTSQSSYHPGASMGNGSYTSEDVDPHHGRYDEHSQTRRSNSFAPEQAQRPVLMGPSASMPLTYDTVEPRQHQFHTPTRPIPLSRRKSDSAHIFRMRREEYTGGAHPPEDPQRPASTGRVRERTGASRILSSADAVAAARARHYSEPEVQIPIGEYGRDEEGGDQDPELSEWVAKFVHSMDESSVDDMDVSERNQHSDIGAEDLEPLPMDLLGTTDHDGDDASEQFGQLLDI